MALLADKSANADSNLVQGNGTSSLTFPMPGNVQLDVESVVATIDNTGGGDTFATLVVRDQSGEVIATKRQSESIPAGDTGTASWSLRLPDSGDASGFTLRQGLYSAPSLAVGAAGNHLAWGFDVGDAILDLTIPEFPQFTTAGLYALHVLTVYEDADVAGKFFVARLDSTGSIGFSYEMHNSAPLISTQQVGHAGNTIVADQIVGGQTGLYILHSDGVVVHHFSGAMLVQQITAQ